jgi:hypothetical protein
MVVGPIYVKLATIRISHSSGTLRLTLKIKKYVIDRDANEYK